MCEHKNMNAQIFYFFVVHKNTKLYHMIHNKGIKCFVTNL